MPSHIDIDICRFSGAQGNCPRSPLPEPLAERGGDLAFPYRVEQVTKTLDIREPDKRRDSDERPGRGCASGRR